MNDEKCDVPHVRCLANVGEEGECYMMSNALNNSNEN